MPHRDLSRRDVRNQHGNEEGRRSRFAVIEEVLRLIPKRLDAADATPVRHAHAVLLVLGHGVGVKTRIGHGFIGGDEGVLAERIHAPHLFFVEVLGGVKVLEFAGEGRAQAFGVERLDGACTARSVHQPVPERIDRMADGRKRSHTGNDNPACGSIHRHANSQWQKQRECTRRTALGDVVRVRPLRNHPCSFGGFDRRNVTTKSPASRVGRRTHRANQLS